MKRVNGVLALAAFTLPLVSSSLFAAPALKTEKDKVSYLIGYQIGSNFKRDGIEVDTAILLSALKEAIAGTTSTLSQEESQKVMENLQTGLRAKAEAKQKSEGEANLKAGKAYLATNAKKPGWKTLPSGLQYKIVKEGSGATPKETDTVKTNYKGTLLDGTEFDSSYKRGQPATFPVNGVIKGWTEALQLMKPGSKWELAIPSDLAYGDRGAGGTIGPNATLLFDVELIGIETPTTAKKEDAPKAATKK
jgi:FKBP-type peptidyl-prolyl cis-trans isomerase FklB